MKMREARDSELNEYGLRCRVIEYRQKIEELNNGIKSVIDDELKHFNDLQYGKGKLKELIK